ncbi:hypothetical protein AG1IA_08581 [Rhizoctonia solani AG-1 IA]|uniref:Uncharacterized protein n=1 Tax=Thanatephorus cucumeris (strain AG1-IA) TaxID=983506 RepID=L8WKQ4_THACA|nr:hypothetical protein AG1IA_08581 [Rhizoctonia solani AG-1 IA]
MTSAQGHLLYEAHGPSNDVIPHGSSVKITVYFHRACLPLASPVPTARLRPPRLASGYVRPTIIHLTKPTTQFLPRAGSIDRIVVPAFDSATQTRY